MNKTLEILWDVFLFIGSFMICSAVLIIGLCLLTMILSMSIDCVTGYDLIREVIRPFFQHLGR